MAIIGIIIARTFGQHVYGKYTLAFSVVSAFSVIFTMGADQIVIRQVAQKQELASKNFVTAFWIRLFAFPTAIIIIGLVGWTLGYPVDQQVYIWLAALITGLTIAADLPRVIFLGLQRMQYDLIGRSIEKLSMLAIVIFIVLGVKETRLSNVMLGMVVGTVIGLFVSGYQLYTQIDRYPLKLTRTSLDLLRVSVPLAGSMAIFFINQQLSIILLSRYTEIGEIGLFNAAYGLVAPFSIIPVAFVTAVLPVMAILFKSPDKRSQIFFNKYLALILAISFPISMVLQWIGEDIINILFGTDYMPAFSLL